MQRRAAGDIRAVLVSVRVGGGVTLRVADAVATHGMRGRQFREHQSGAAAAAVVPVQPTAPEAVAAELLHRGEAEQLALSGRLASAGL